MLLSNWNIVIVTEGCPPELKQATIHSRNGVRFADAHTTSKKPCQRKRLLLIQKECCELLDCLGVPHLQSDGEAEALCAQLNALHLVDACVTEDSDVFGYGARCVLRGITVDQNKGIEGEIIDMRDIEIELDLNRSKIIALAILIGCDYSPKGVAGVGRQAAMDFVCCCDDPLDRLLRWGRCAEYSSDSVTEHFVMVKALKDLDFPVVAKKVTDEFLRRPLEQFASYTSDFLKPKCPDIAGFQKFAMDKLKWTASYALQKVLPLVAHWLLTNIAEDASFDASTATIRLLSILKTRKKNCVQCYELQWHISDENVLVSNQEHDQQHHHHPLTTVNEQRLVAKAFPQLVDQFEATRKQRTKTKRTKKKPLIPQEKDISDVLERLEISSTGRLDDDNNDFLDDDDDPFVAPKTGDALNDEEDMAHENEETSETEDDLLFLPLREQLALRVGAGKLVDFAKPRKLSKHLSISSPNLRANSLSRVPRGVAQEVPTKRSLDDSVIEL